MNYLNYILAYYIFIFEQYIIHNIQHTTEYFKTHKLKHHKTYSRVDITEIVNYNSIFENIDFYFYGSLLCLLANSYIFDKNIIIFQLFLAYLSFYFHSQYHTPNSIWKHFKFFKYLKRKHTNHHIYPRTNYFLIDPIFDIIFGTYK